MASAAAKPSAAHDSTTSSKADKLGESRTNVNKKTKAVRASTLQKIAEEAKAILGQEVSVSAERKLRVRKPRVAAPAKKAAPKRPGTGKTKAKNVKTSGK